MKKFLTILVIAVISSSLYFCNISFSSDASRLNKPIRIGYFDGGRVHLFWRAYINKYFDDVGVNVELYTKYLKEKGLHKVPRDFEGIQRKSLVDGEKTYFGKQTGTEIIEAMLRGDLEGGTVGESSFIQAISNNSPIVAVAKLGHETINGPAKAIAIRKDVIINTPHDFKGKILITRRSGPIDAIILREFIESIGLDPEKDLTIIDQIPDDKQEEFLKEKKIHGGIFHLHKLASIVKKDLAYIYRKMDWINPEISQGLLVFRKDFVETYPQEVKKIIRSYMKRIKYEQGIPEEEKIKEKRYGLQMVLYFQGMSLPQYDYPPLVSPDLLNEAQSLLLKYKFIDKKIDLTKFINNGFVKELYEELK